MTAPLIRSGLFRGFRRPSGVLHWPTDIGTEELPTLVVNEAVAVYGGDSNGGSNGAEEA